VKIPTAHNGTLSYSGMAGSLFVVATPIGNLDDITVRALETLKHVGLIAAEDTRRTGQLLRHFGIPTPTTSLHEHNEAEKVPALLQKLTAGVDVAIVSDAGTPLVADPGQRLVAAAVGQGIRVVPIPGASATLAALAASGYPADEFVFAGFVPSRPTDRTRWMAALADEPRTVVFFEAPHRISRTLSEIALTLGERPICITRELTKIHEQVLSTVANAADKLDIVERGEFALVLAPQTIRTPVAADVDDVQLRNEYRHLTASDMARREAITATAHKFGLSTNAVYARLERSKDPTP
jgi:16S rRNA (cytidine1402-2'-O)-methyltransferase